MASPSVVRDVVTCGGVEPAYLGKHEQLTTRNGCHGNEQTSSGTPKRQTSAKKEQEDVTGDISTTASPRAKGPKKTSKRVDGKKTKRTQICAQTRREGVKERVVTCNISQSQPNHGNSNSKSEDVSQAMSELKISDRGGKKTEADKGTTNAMESQLKKLSLEDTQQLLERGPQRNRDSHNAHQAKPYDKSTDPTGQRSANNGTDDQDTFIQSVLFGAHVVGAPGDESGSFVRPNLPSCEQPSVDFVDFDQWLDSITGNSPHHNVPSSTTIDSTGNYQFSDPSVSLASVGVQSIDQSCGQVPVIVTMSVPVQTVPQLPYYHGPVPLTHSTQQTFVSGHQISTALVHSGAPVSNAYILLGEDNCYNPNVSPVITRMPGNYYQPSPSGNMCVPHGNGTFMAAAGQAVPMGNSGMRGKASSGMESESTLNSQISLQRVQADPNIQTQCDADLTKFSGHNPIPTVVPENFDDDPNEDDTKQKKRGKRNKNGKASTRKTSPTTKKERKSKDSPKKMPLDSVPTQSPGSNSGDVSQLNLTASPLTNRVTPPLANDQAAPLVTVPGDFDAIFEDSLNVVKSNLEEDIFVRKIKKQITSAARQGTSEPPHLGEQRNTSNNVGSVSPLPNYQLPQSSSAVNQPQNTYDGAYAPNSLAHSQQPIPPMTVTRQVTHEQHMATLMPPVSVDQELLQTSQIQYPVSSNDLVYQTTNSMSSQQQLAFPADTLSTNSTFEQTTQFPPHDQNAPFSQSTLSLGYQQAAYGLAPTTQPMMTSPSAGLAHSVAPVVQNSPVFQPISLQPPNVQTQVNVNVTHQTPSHQFQQQPGPNAQYQHQGPIGDLNNVQFKAFGAFRQFKMTTAGFAGSKPIGASAIEVIMKKLPPILPKPSVS